jgi:hypothetical protein
MQFGHKCRTANPGHVLAGDDQAQIGCKLRLFHKAKRFGGISHTLHVGEWAFQHRLPQESLEGIVVY